MIIYVIIMDETTYSQILHFYSSSDRKYPRKYPHLLQLIVYIFYVYSAYVYSTYELNK